MSTSTASFSAILFDMDGTLIDSTEAVNSALHNYCERLGLDPVETMKTSHGVRTIENLAIWHKKAGKPITEAELDQAVIDYEAEIIRTGKELNDAGLKGHASLPGVKDLLASLRSDEKEYWALVTSATSTYAVPAMKLSKVDLPQNRITAEICTAGKPDPQPYLKGAAILNLDPSECLCVEDAPAGVTSGSKAGCKVLAVCTSHSRSRMEQTEATWVVDDLTKVKASIKDGKVVMEIDTRPAASA